MHASTSFEPRAWPVSRYSARLPRGEARSASDVDLVLELDELSALGLLELVDLKETLAEELGRPVDIAFRSRLRPWFAARIAPELVRVF